MLGIIDLGDTVLMFFFFMIEKLVKSLCHFHLQFREEMK